MAENRSSFTSRFLGRTVVAILLIFLFWTGLAAADAGYAAGTAKSGGEQSLMNGTIIAEEISRATGIAISPILGLSVLGAYTYYTTPPEKRELVPWYARPAFWTPLLVVLLGIILKDSAKIALPKIIVMPLDAIETLLEKNASAALGLLVILSSVSGRGLDQLRLARFLPHELFVPAANAAQHFSHAAVSGILETGILAMAITVVFTVVWVVSQSFNFLILLCPSSWLDLLLTCSKNSIVALLLGGYLINPFLGLFLSIPVIVISAFLFARSYRFVIFGTIFASDILLGKSRKNAVGPGMIRAFAGPSAAGIPSLSYGYLANQKGMLLFQYRPWLLLPRRSIPLPMPASRCEAGKATVAPVILYPGENEKQYTVLFRLRPLYHSHEEKIAEILGLGGVRDVTFGRSLRAGLAWLGEQLGLRSQMKRDVG